MEEFTLWIKSLDTNSSSVKDNTPRRCVRSAWSPRGKGRSWRCFLGGIWLGFDILDFSKDARKFSVARSHHSPTPFLPPPQKKKLIARKKKAIRRSPWFMLGGRFVVEGWWWWKNVPLPAPKGLLQTSKKKNSNLWNKSSGSRRPSHHYLKNGEPVGWWYTLTYYLKKNSWNSLPTPTY